MKTDELRKLVREMIIEEGGDGSDYVVDKIMVAVKDHVVYVIGDDYSELDHTVGSHSDDRGGDSDRPCHCQRDWVAAVNFEKAGQRNRAGGY